MVEEGGGRQGRGCIFDKQFPYILPKRMAGRVETASVDPLLWFGAEERGEQLVSGDHDSAH